MCNDSIGKYTNFKLKYFWFIFGYDINWIFNNMIIFGPNFLTFKHNLGFKIMLKVCAECSARLKLKKKYQPGGDMGLGIGEW